MYYYPDRGPSRTIVFQGKPGAFSQMACQACYPSYTITGLHDFNQCFDAVSKNNADIAMIPIENGLGGRVADVHHLLPNTNLYIIGEYFQQIEHCILAQSHVSLQDIAYIYSHPQALAQTSNIIRENDWQPHDYIDTAGAAEYIASLSYEEAKNKAAIASVSAHHIYGLHILQKSVQNYARNYTRFIILSREPETHYDASQQYLTSLVFTLDSIPASLYKCIGGFATNGVNMIKLESYISANHWEHAQFYLEIEGHQQQDDVKRALDELRYFASNDSVIMLGSFISNRHFD